MEIPGFTPTRRVEQVAEGFMVYVKPPFFVNAPEVVVFLTSDQYQRYLSWREKGVMIQEALPELSASQREMLMTGLGDEDFRRVTRDYD